jgi:glutathione peroxidase
MGALAMSDRANIYSYSVRTIDGQEISMSTFAQKTLLIVNTASECGFTNQYEGLEKLFETYRTRNFAVLGFPCNQFGGQESGDEEKIKNFCTRNYSVTFPLFAKVKVNGADQSPLFKFLKESVPGLFGTRAIKWNFTKFLVDASGIPVGRFAPRVTPQDLESAVIQALDR